MKPNLILIIAVIFAVIAGQPAFAVNYPEPVGFVTDTAGMIDQSEEEKIEKLCRDIEKNSSVEIAVVTVNSLEGLTKEEYAVKLFEKWGIGKKDKDNGLLILLAKEERVYRVEVGYGMEDVITDSHKVDIGIKIMEPRFREGEFGKGIYNAVVAINGLINGHPEVVSDVSGDDDSGDSMRLFLYLFIPFLLVCLLIWIYSRFNLPKQDKVSGKKKNKRDSGYWGGYGGSGRSGGGWSGGGGFGGGGFGGFGGGSSGGGGFGGGW